MFVLLYLAIIFQFLRLCKQDTNTTAKVEYVDEISKQIRERIRSIQQYLDEDQVYIPRMYLSRGDNQISMQLAPFSNYRLPSCVFSVSRSASSCLSFSPNPDTPFSRGNEVFSSCYQQPFLSEFEDNSATMHPLDCEMCLWMSEINRMKDFLHEPIESSTKAVNYSLYRDSSLDHYLSLAASLGSFGERRSELSFCLVAGYEELKIPMVRYLALAFSPKNFQIFLVGGASHVDVHPQFRLGAFNLAKRLRRELHVPMDVHNLKIPMSRPGQNSRTGRTTDDSLSAAHRCSVVYIVGGVLPTRDVIQLFSENDKLDVFYWHRIQELRKKNNFGSSNPSIDTDFSHLSVLILHERAYHSSHHQMREELAEENIGQRGRFSIFWQYANRLTNNIFQPKSIDCLPTPIRISSATDGSGEDTIIRERLHTCSSQSYRFYISYRDRRYELRVGEAIIHSQYLVDSIGMVTPRENVLSVTLPGNDILKKQSDYPSFLKAYQNRQNNRNRSFPSEIIFITYDVTMFIENALGLQEILQQRLGIRRVEIMGPMNHTRYRELAEELGCFLPFSSGTAGLFSCDKLIQIAIAPHRPTVLTLNYIVFHTENSWDSFLDASDCPDGYVDSDNNFNATSYQSILVNSKAILIYSDHNRELMKGQQAIPEDMLNSKVFTIPMYTKSLYFDAALLLSNGTIEDVTKLSRFEDELPTIVYRERIFEGASFQRESSVDHPKKKYRKQIQLKSFDISILMSNSERRRKFLAHISKRSMNDALSVFQTQDVCIDGYDLWTKEYLIATSTVGMNFHQFDDSILETHRVNQMLSLGMPVVSERSFVDPALDKQYENAIMFADDWDELYDKVLYLTKNDTARKELSMKALKKYFEIMNDVRSIKNAMKSVLRRPLRSRFASLKV